MATAWAGPWLLLALVNAVMAWQILRFPRAPFHRAALWGLGALLLASLPSLLSRQGGGWRDFQDEVRQNVQQAFDRAEKSGSLQTGQAQATEALAERVFLGLLPAWTLMAGFFWLSLDEALLHWLLERFGKIPPRAPLARWALPDALIWALLISAFALLWLSWGGQEAGHPLLLKLSANLAALLLPAYLLDGFLVGHWQLARWRFPRWLRWTVWAALVLFLSPLTAAVGLMLMVVGVLDTWFDFRKVRDRPAAD